MNALALSVVLAGAILAVAGGSCSDASPSEPAAGAEFKLRVGGSATLPEGGPAVTFAGVVADSRCPTGVQCVWAGEVKVALDVARGGEAAARLELTLGPDPAKAAAALDGCTLRLLAVDPYPKAGVEIAPDQYQATLRADRD